MESNIKDTDTARRNKSALGRAGEIAAARYLEGFGMKILAMNFTAPIGRNRKNTSVMGEIDIIAIDQGSVRFVEVKTRAQVGMLPIETSVTLRKRRNIEKTAKVFKRIFNLGGRGAGFDVVTVLYGTDTEPEIRLIPDFW